ncbi:MAG TPA: hypothetical protein VKA95_08195 [Nitrososphaeraceae archaeon]|nr:hypothetical protein [Nitrososphaeraceae archaeon]
MVGEATCSRLQKIPSGLSAKKTLYKENTCADESDDCIAKLGIIASK